MTWLEIALIASNVVTIAVAAWRFTGRVAELQREIDRCDRAVSYYCDRVCRLAKSNRTQGFALRYYANPQAWQSPERGKHSDAFRDRGERAREALEAAKKILEEGK